MVNRVMQEPAINTNNPTEMHENAAGPLFDIIDKILSSRCFVHSPEFVDSFTHWLSYQGHFETVFLYPKPTEPFAVLRCSIISFKMA